MTAPVRFEECCLCYAPTGKAGAGDGSIYWETSGGTLGPLCDLCNDELRDQFVRASVGRVDDGR